MSRQFVHIIPTALHCFLVEKRVKECYGKNGVKKENKRDVAPGAGDSG
jgi:hypothetical protein